MKKQYAVLGLGNFGVSVALSLQQLGCEVIAVDEDMEKGRRLFPIMSPMLCGQISVNHL